MIATYIVAFSAMLFAAVSALSLISAVNHFDGAAPNDHEAAGKIAA
jgi:hypothetical protein